MIRGGWRVRKRYDRELGVTTDSLVIRSRSRSIRRVQGTHHLDPEHIFDGRRPGDVVDVVVE